MSIRASLFLMGLGTVDMAANWVIAGSASLSVLPLTEPITSPLSFALLAGFDVQAMDDVPLWGFVFSRKNELLCSEGLSGHISPVRGGGQDKIEFQSESES